jgi:CO dehydrogenase maturation factor
LPRSIAVAGKGGTGKTTIAALLVTQLVLQNQGPVLAMDADPDSNLGDLLGVQPEQSIGDLREEVLEAIKKWPAGMTKASYVEAGLHRIIEEAEGFDLLTMGRGEGPGCYCALNNMIRKFSDDLTPSYRWVVMDNEAGLEHLSRRTTRNIDALLVVVSDNPLSLRSAEKIQAITNDLETRIRHKYIVTNMISEAKIEAFERRLEAIQIPHLVDIPYDPHVEEIIFEGEPLKKLNGSPIMKTIQTIIETVGGEDANS